LAATPESLVKKAIKKLLVSAKAYYAMPMGSGYGSTGVPDFLVCCNGRFIGIEAKAGKGKPTALQLSNLRQIVDAGGVALVVNESNINELEEILVWIAAKKET
jgi:hypothetical protein